MIYILSKMYNKCILMYYSVSGFNHKSFDVEVAQWHTHYYPYKLANYQNTFLCEPITLCILGRLYRLYIYIYLINIVISVFHMIVNIE